MVPVWMLKTGGDLNVLSSCLFFSYELLIPNTGIWFLDLFFYLLRTSKERRCTFSKVFSFLKGKLSENVPLCSYFVTEAFYFMRTRTLNLPYGRILNNWFRYGPCQYVELKPPTAYVSMGCSRYPTSKQ